MPPRQAKAAPRRKSSRSSPPFALRIPITGRYAVDVLAFASVVLGVLCLLALTFPPGQVTGPLMNGMGRVFGWTAWLAPVWLIGLGLLRLLVSLRDASVPMYRLVGAVLLTLALPALVQMLPIGDPDPARRALELRSGGGALGFYLAVGLSDAFGWSAAAVLLVAACALGLLLLFELTMTQVTIVLARAGRLVGRLAVRGSIAFYHRFFGPRLRVNQPRPSVAMAKPPGFRLSKVLSALGRFGLARSSDATNRPEPAAVAEKTPDEAGEWVRRSAPPPAEEPPDEPKGRPAPRTSQSSPPPWRLPASSLFAAATAVELSQADVRAQAKVIEDTLASFNIQARITEVNSGPTVTQFGIDPAPGVAVNRIMARGNDLALRLGATALRMEAPVPGRRVVGVEVPNRAGAMVSLRELLESGAWTKTRSKLRLALGRDVSGNAVVGDLAKMPHLLIAGATGSGKSVCINSIIASLIYQSTPGDLQFVMIDPKMVELVGFNGIPHLRMPVVTDMDRVVGSLKWVVREMERRYKLFAARSARNIEAFNKLIEDDPAQTRMPFLVVVIDELADMMMTAGDEVERIICRLAQLARATGIHLVVATQRPSVDVITGLIKANFPTRISFAVSSHIDSRTILDTAGAEKLLGRGDMLFLPQDSSKPIRIQGAYVSDEEMQKLVEFWRKLGVPSYSPEDLQEIESLGRAEDVDGDELYDKAVDVATQYRRVSTSLLQRRLGIGYPRAARLVDLLEDRGVVGPSEDGKSREVLEHEPLPVE